VVAKILDGGDRLKRRLADIARKLDRAGSVKIGFLEGATYPETGTPVATVAMYQEFGTPGAQFPIPPRPFFRTMIKEKASEWPTAIAALVTDEDYDAARVFDRIGAAVAGQLRESIIDMNGPPLSEVTLMLRSMKSADPNLRITRRTVYEAIRRVRAEKTSGLGGTGAKPLVDDGTLLAAVDYEVETK
jgi:hypothetical protein